MTRIFKILRTIRTIRSTRIAMMTWITRTASIKWTLKPITKKGPMTRVRIPSTGWDNKG